MIPDHLNFPVPVVAELVEAYEYSLAIFPEVLDMPVKVGESFLDPFRRCLGNLVRRHSAMHLETAEGGYEYGERRGQPALAAFDVEEFLRSEVCAEAGLRNHVVPVCHSHLRGNDGVAAVCNVGERTAVNEGRRAFRSLYQVRLHRVEKEGGNRACHSHVLDSERLVVQSIAQQNILYSSSEVVHIL